MNYFHPATETEFGASATIAECVDDLLTEAGISRTTSVIRDGGTISSPSLRENTRADVILWSNSAKKDFPVEAEAAAANILGDALFEGKLSAYVQGLHASRFQRLPRTYWWDYDFFKHLHDCYRIAKREPAVPEDHIGQTIYLDHDAFRRWAKSDGVTALSSELQKPAYSSAGLAPADPSAGPLPPNDKEKYEQALNQLVQDLNSAGVARRKLSKADIVSRWDAKKGAAPKVEPVRVMIDGKGKGGRPPGT